LAGDVEDALDGAARKHFVLGGAEIVALAALTVIALRVIVTRGVGEVTTKESTTVHADGSIVVVIDKTTKAITITEDLAAMFRGFFGKKEGN
jgi:hypothetical protein